MWGTADKAFQLFMALLNSMDAKIDTILAAIGVGSALGVEQSPDGAVERGVSKSFSIALYDRRGGGGTVLVADIDITSATVVLEKSTGVGYSTAGITQPAPAKADGQALTTPQFIDGEWAAGTTYQCTMDGVEATVNGQVYKVGKKTWSGVVHETGDLEANLDAVKLVTDAIPDAGAMTTIAKVAALTTHDTDVKARLTGVEGATFDTGTDSLEAIRDASVVGLAAVTDRLDGSIDATNRAAGRANPFQKAITSAANAGLVTVGTVTAQAVVIERVIVKAVTAAQVDLTSAAVKGGAAQVITFLSAIDAAKANIDAVDEQVFWEGSVELAAGKLVQIDLQGTGATAVNLLVTVIARAVANGGHIA